MIDESRKYREDYAKLERTKEQMRKDLCVAFDEIVLLQKKLRKIRSIRTAIISVVTLLGYKGLEFFFPIFLRWLGLS